MTMATRFAGDFFGVPLTTPGESGGSSLLAYFPELRSTKKSKTSDEGESEEARSFRGTKAVSPFVGFKTFLCITSINSIKPRFCFNNYII